MAQRRDDSFLSEELHSEFKRKKFKPLYFFYGEEDFLVEETIDLLIKEAVDDSWKSFNLDCFYGSEAEAREVVGIAASYPMMAERRVVVLREVEKIADKEILLSYLNCPSATTSFVFVSHKPDFRQSFFKQLKEKSFSVEFRQLPQEEIPKWIINRFKTVGKEISKEVAECIPVFVGTSLREIHNEMQKLSIYVGDKTAIEFDDVKNVVGISKRYNIIELQRAIAQRDIRQSIEIVERMIEVGESLTGMIAYLTQFFRKVWLVKELQTKKVSDSEIASKLKLWVNYLKDFKQASTNFSDEELEGCFMALANADETLKSTSTDNKLVMTLLFYQILSSNRSFAVS